MAAILDADDAARLPHALAAFGYYFDFSVEWFDRYQVSRPWALATQS